MGGMSAPERGTFLAGALERQDFIGRSAGTVIFSINFVFAIENLTKFMI